MKCEEGNKLDLKNAANNFFFNSKIIIIQTMAIMK